MIDLLSMTAVIDRNERVRRCTWFVADNVELTELIPCSGATWGLFTLSLSLSFSHRKSGPGLSFCFED